MRDEKYLRLKVLAKVKPSISNTFKGIFYRDPVHASPIAFASDPNIGESQIRPGRGHHNQIACRNGAVPKNSDRDVAHYQGFIVGLAINSSVDITLLGV